MSFSDSDILRKIRALLAKAASTDSPAEAMACAAKARELLRNYRIDPAKAQEHAYAEEIGETVHEREKIPGWTIALAFAAAHLFNCRIYRMNRRMVFFGREGDRVTACEMYSFFISAVDKATKAWKARAREQDVLFDESMFRNEMADEIQRRAERMAGDHQVLALVDKSMPPLSNSRGGGGYGPFYGGESTSAAARDAAGKVGLHRQTTHTPRGLLPGRK
jgi:hypothetical protein